MEAHGARRSYGPPWSTSKEWSLFLEVQRRPFREEVRHVQAEIAQGTKEDHRCRGFVQVTYDGQVVGQELEYTKRGVNR